jgi:hypothetical protein
MSFSFDARKEVSVHALARTLWAAALAAGVATIPTAAARAQVYLQPYVQTYYWQGPAQPRGAPMVSRREVAAILYDEGGYRLDGPIDYRDDAIVAVGVDDYGRRMRFVIDPEGGEVIGARRLSQQASRSDLGDEDPRAEQPRAPRPQSRPRETSTPAPPATPRKERLSDIGAAPAPRQLERRLHQSPPPLGSEQGLTRHEKPAAPAGSSHQPSRPQTTAPVAQGAARPAAAAKSSPPPASPPTGAAQSARPESAPRPEGPPAPGLSSVKPASPQPAATPVAHGSAHRAIVPPPAVQTATTPPQSPPAAQPAPVAPAAPVVGAFREQGPSADTPSGPVSIVVKPTGG